MCILVLTTLSYGVVVIVLVKRDGHWSSVVALRVEVFHSYSWCFRFSVPVRSTPHLHFVPAVQYEVSSFLFFLVSIGFNILSRSLVLTMFVIG